MMKYNVTGEDRMITLICVLLIVALMIAVGFVIARPAYAAQKNTSTLDYEAAYVSLLNDYDRAMVQSEATDSSYQRQLDALRLELEQAQMAATQALEARDQAYVERDQALDHLEELKAEYGVQYIVVFEVRRKIGFPASEECIRFTVPMSADAYAQFQQGSEVTQVLPCLSIPSDSFNVDWSITVANTYIATGNIPS